MGWNVEVTSAELDTIAGSGIAGETGMAGQSLTILCAHLSEGRPFVAHYDLMRHGANANLYVGDRVRLVITGQGVKECRKTLDRVFSEVPVLSGDIWLNFGIAGIGIRGRNPERMSVRPGQLIWVRRVMYEGQQWTLSIRSPAVPEVPEKVFATDGILRTVDRPETDFNEDLLYDMECAGIVAHLVERNRLPCLAVVKLVADGPGQSGPEALSLGRELLLEHRSSIVEWSDRLLEAVDRDRNRLRLGTEGIR